MSKARHTVAAQPPILGPTTPVDQVRDSLQEAFKDIDFNHSWSPKPKDMTTTAGTYYEIAPHQQLRVILVGGILWLRENTHKTNDLVGLRHFTWSCDSTVDDGAGYENTVVRKSVLHNGLLGLVEAIGLKLSKSQHAGVGALIVKRVELVRQGVLSVMGIKIKNPLCLYPHRCADVWNSFTVKKNGRVMNPTSLPANLTPRNVHEQQSGVYACCLNVMTDQHVAVKPLDADNENGLRCEFSLPVDAKGKPDIKVLVKNPWYNQFYKYESQSMPPAHCVAALLEIRGIYVSSTNIGDARIKLQASPVTIIAQSQRRAQIVQQDEHLLSALNSDELESLLALNCGDTEDSTGSGNNNNDDDDNIDGTSRRMSFDDKGNASDSEFACTALKPGISGYRAERDTQRPDKSDDNMRREDYGNYEIDPQEDGLMDAISVVAPPKRKQATTTTSTTPSNPKQHQKLFGANKGSSCSSKSLPPVLSLKGGKLTGQNQEIDHGTGTSPKKTVDGIQDICTITGDDDDEDDDDDGETCSLEETITRLRHEEPSVENYDTADTDDGRSLQPPLTKRAKKTNPRIEKVDKVTKTKQSSAARISSKKGPAPVAKKSSGSLKPPVKQLKSPGGVKKMSSLFKARPQFPVQLNAPTIEQEVFGGASQTIGTTRKGFGINSSPTQSNNPPDEYVIDDGDDDDHDDDDDDNADGEVFD